MKKIIVGSISRGQAHEILNQIENAMKAAGVNPEEKACELIRTNFFGKKTKELLGKSETPKVLSKMISHSIFTLKLDSCDGSKTISKSSGVFSWIDDDNFRIYGADEKGINTKETAIEVYEMAKDATFAQMFGSLSNDLDKLCLTQSQILNFIAKHRPHLRKDGHETFFLFKSNNQFFVANVRFTVGDLLNVYVFRFEVDFVWEAGLRLRVVVPQLGT